MCVFASRHSGRASPCILLNIPDGHTKEKPTAGSKHKDMSDKEVSSSAYKLCSAAFFLFYKMIMENILCRACIILYHGSMYSLSLYHVPPVIHHYNDFVVTEVHISLRLYFNLPSFIIHSHYPSPISPISKVTNDILWRIKEYVWEDRGSPYS